jgi:hypothetical protein
MRKQSLTGAHTSEVTSRPFAISTANDDGAPVTDSELEAAIEAVDFAKCDPNPRATSHWKSTGRTIFLHFITHLKSAMAQADFNDPREFHSFFWMIVRLGANQRSIAKAHHVSATVVSRWLNGKQTPELLRRRMILESALASLDKNLSAQKLVPLKEYDGLRAPRLGKVSVTMTAASG